MSDEKKSKYFYWVQYTLDETGEVVSRYVAKKNLDDFLDLEKQKSEGYIVNKVLKIIK